MADWADELETFLENESYSEFSRQEKAAMLLHSIAQMLETPEDKNGNAGEVVPVPKIETKSYKASRASCLLCFLLLCIVSFGAVKYWYCQDKSLKLCWNNSIQDWIYPVLRAIRLFALPIIQYFPAISGRYTRMLNVLISVTRLMLGLKTGLIAHFG